MELEDEYRFEVEAMDAYAPEIWLNCTRCSWVAEIEGRITLAELNQRAAEHAEVCR